MTREVDCCSSKEQKEVYFLDLLIWHFSGLFNYNKYLKQQNFQIKLLDIMELF